MEHIFRQFVEDDAGQDLIEYAMVGAILALGSMAILRGYSINIGKVFGGIGAALTNAV